jgi:hypothetical protein
MWPHFAPAVRASIVPPPIIAATQTIIGDEIFLCAESRRGYRSRPS